MREANLASMSARLMLLERRVRRYQRLTLALGLVLVMGFSLAARGAPSMNQLPLSMICTLPLNGGAPIPCPSGTASSRSSQLGLLAGDLAAFGSLLAS